VRGVRRGFIWVDSGAVRDCVGFDDIVIKAVADGGDFCVNAQQRGEEVNDSIVARGVLQLGLCAAIR
jgi:hypothetical protein